MLEALYEALTFGAITVSILIIGEYVYRRWVL